MHLPHLIGIAGPSGAGKTALARCLAKKLSEHASVILSIDSYYLGLPQTAAKTEQCLNFDTPKALDLDLLVSHIHQLAAGQSIERPVYDFHTHTRMPRTEKVNPGKIVVAEGLLALYLKEVRVLLGTRVFVKADNETCLRRRLRRDIKERNRNERSVREQWEKTVRPMFKRYIQPTQRYANIVVDGTAPLEQIASVVLQEITLNIQRSE